MTLGLEWIATWRNIPAGGQRVNARYERGTQSSKVHIAHLDPLLSPIVGGPLFRGSLNLWSDADVELPEPYVVELSYKGRWWFVPIVLNEAAVGVVARTAESGSCPFMEVFAHREIVPVLGLKPGDTPEIRLLPGSLLY